MPIHHTINDIFMQLQKDLAAIVKEVMPLTVEKHQHSKTEFSITTRLLTIDDIKEYILSADNAMSQIDETEHVTKAGRLLDKFYTGEHINDFYLTYLDELSSRFHDWVSEQYDFSYFENEPASTEHIKHTALSDSELQKADNDVDVALLTLEMRLYDLFWAAVEKLELSHVISLLEDKYALNSVKSK